MVMVLFPFRKGLQAHLDGHLEDVHPDVHLDVQFIMVIVLWTFPYPCLLKSINAPC